MGGDSGPRVAVVLLGQEETSDLPGHPFPAMAPQLPACAQTTARWLVTYSGLLPILSWLFQFAFEI